LVIDWAEEAFRAITIDAAHALRKENEIGSIDLGKQASFTVFEENPITAEPKALKDLAIWGTVYEGKKYQIKKAFRGLVMSAENQKRLVMLNDYASTSVHRHHGDACTADQILEAGASVYGNEK
jgi:hypothetical protein